MSLSSSSARLMIAVAKQQNFQVISKVVDESIERAAEARRKSEAIRAEREAQEARADRIAEIQRREREAAEAVARTRRAQIEEAAAASEARKEQARAQWIGPIDQLA